MQVRTITAGSRSPSCGTRSTRLHPTAQRGVALVISLVLLVAMSLLAVSALSGSRLSERVAGNAQQKAVAFQVAESAIEAGFDPDELIEALDRIPVDQFNDPDRQRVTTFNALLADEFDQQRTDRSGDTVASVNIDGEVWIQYCGETPLPNGTDLSADESGVQLVGLLFDVNGIAGVPASATSADHVQRGLLVRPKTGRTGACVTRGT